MPKRTSHAQAATDTVNTETCPIDAVNVETCPTDTVNAETIEPVFKFSCSECQCENYPECTYTSGEPCEDCMNSTDNTHRLNRNTGVLSP